MAPVCQIRASVFLCIAMTSLVANASARSNDQPAWVELGKLVRSDRKDSLNKIKLLLGKNPKMDLNREDRFPFLHEAQCTDSRTLLSLLPLEAEELSEAQNPLQKAKHSLLKQRGATRRNCLLVGRPAKEVTIELRKSPSAKALLVESLAVTPESALVVTSEDNGWFHVGTYYPKGYGDKFSVSDLRDASVSGGKRSNGWVAPGMLMLELPAGRRPETAQGELAIQACRIRDETPIAQVIDINRNTFVVEAPRTLFGCGGG